MTASACPVCATPYEAGATVCAFCGVSLVEPEPKPAAKPRTRTRSAPKAATQPEARAAASTSPAPVEAIELPAKEPPPAPAQIVEPIAGETPLPTHAEIVEPVADEAPSPAPAAIDGIVATPANEPEPAPAETPETSGIPGNSAPPPATKTPSFARDRAAASVAQRRAQRIEWGIVAGLAALLLVQMVASDFDQLAAGSTTRPWLQATCHALRCRLPPWREPQALHLLQRDVQANPQRPGLLRISASFRNEARWTQPWPRLRVVLSDTDGRAIAARDFAANEYLGAMPTTNGIASGQVASIAFDVADPSPRVTAFTFEFR